MRDVLVRCACMVLSGYFRHVPVPWGKLFLWNRVVRPYLAWRNIPVMAHTQFGARMGGRFPDVIQTYLYFFGRWEPVITEFFRDRLRPGDTVIDVGANIGAHTLLAASLVGPGGRVHAIEASPTIFRRLRANIAANDAGNVTTHNVAIAEAPGTVAIYLGDDYNPGSTSILSGHVRHAETRKEADVPARRLQDVVPLDELRRARLIKIDVEGAEWLVVKGMAEVLPLLSDRTEILLEVSREALAAFGVGLEDMLATFRAAGFAPRRLENSYEVEFYLRPARLTLQELSGEPPDLMDLVFSRTLSAAAS